MEKNCGNCGKPLEIKPRNGEWGKQYTGKKGLYWSFVKCDDCGYSESSEPNPRPRRGNIRPAPQTPQNSPNLAISSDKDSFKTELLCRLDKQDLLLEKIFKKVGGTPEELGLPF